MKEKKKRVSDITTIYLAAQLLHAYRGEWSKNYTLFAPVVSLPNVTFKK